MLSLYRFFIIIFTDFESVQSAQYLCHNEDDTTKVVQKESNDMEQTSSINGPVYSKEEFDEKDCLMKRGKKSLNLLLIFKI